MKFGCYEQNVALILYHKPSFLAPTLPLIKSYPWNSNIIGIWENRSSNIETSARVSCPILIPVTIRASYRLLNNVELSAI